MSEKVIYEQPLNERIRTFLRLEFLFLRLDKALQGNSVLDHRDAIDSLLNIVTVFERSDLKSEIIKEIERLIAGLSALENMPGVDKQALESLLNQLDQTLDALLGQKSAIGQALRDHDFLYSIRQRSSIPGGTCDFDLPALHYWLRHTPTENRRRQIDTWLEQFIAVRSAIDITLRLIRESVGFREVTAEEGFYQRTLDSNQPTQLIRVEIDNDTGFFPEISGGKHRVTVRFMYFDIDQRPQQAHQTIPFKVSCCNM